MILSIFLLFSTGTGDKNPVIMKHKWRGLAILPMRRELFLYVTFGFTVPAHFSHRISTTSTHRLSEVHFYHRISTTSTHRLSEVLQWKRMNAAQCTASNLHALSAWLSSVHVFCWIEFWSHFVGLSFDQLGWLLLTYLLDWVLFTYFAGLSFDHILLDWVMISLVEFC